MRRSGKWDAGSEIDRINKIYRISHEGGEALTHKAIIRRWS